MSCLNNTDLAYNVVIIGRETADLGEVRDRLVELAAFD
jgi:hypothetical protein